MSWVLMMSWSREFSDSVRNPTPGDIRGVIHDSLEFEQIREFITQKYPHIDREIIYRNKINDKHGLLNIIFPVLSAKNPHNPLFSLAKLDEFIGEDKNSQILYRYRAALIQYGISDAQLANIKKRYGMRKRARNRIIISAGTISLLVIILFAFRFLNRAQTNNIPKDIKSTEKSELPDLPKMVRVPSGVFIMGSPDTEYGRDNDEAQHEEIMQYPFEISETEITQSQYKYVMKIDSPSRLEKPPNYPVDTVRWYDAVAFCNALSKMQGLEECYHVYLVGAERKVEWKNYTCNGYRLPTEAEWEYAARAGTSHLFAGSDNIDSVAWIDVNSGSQSHAVKSKSANKWGIYDMSGNLAEWIWDGYAPDYHGGRDRTFAGAESRRIARGGFFKDEAKTCRVANRIRMKPGNPSEGMGIRIVRTLTADN